MTNEELEQKVKRLEEQLTEVRIELLERKANKKPYEVEVPEDIEDYYTVNRVGCIQKLKNVSKFILENTYQRGLIFKTREEAERFDKERELLFKLHKWAEEHNKGWIPDWADPGNKYIVKYIQATEGFEIAYTWSFNYFTKLPVFKSEEIALKFIKEFSEEIKEVLL